jgi:hypothetical protein
MANEFDQLKITQEAAEGKRTFSKPVRMVDEDGEQYEMLPEEVQEAARSGYKIATPEQKIAKDEAKQAGLVGTAKVFLGQAADEFLGGVPETALELTESPLEKERRLALKAESPIANIAGGVTGAGLSALTPVGPLALAEKAALKGTETALKYAAQAGTKTLASKILAKSAEQGIVGMGLRATGKGIELGAEAAIQQLPSSAIEAALGDPESAAENLMIATGVGGALGFGFKSVGEIGSKVNKTASEMLSKIYNIPKDVAEKALKDLPEGQIDSALKEATQPANVGLLDIMKYEPSPLLPEIEAAGKELGIEKLPLGMTTEKEAYKYAEGYLMKQKGSVGGMMTQAEYKPVMSQLDLTARTLARDAEELSKFQSGNAVKDIVFNKVASNLEQAKVLYKAVDEISDQVALPKKSKDYAKTLLSTDDYKFLLPTEKKQLQEVVQLLDDVNTVGDARRLRVEMGKRLRTAYQSENIGLVNVLNDIRAVSDELIENAVIKGSESPKAVMKAFKEANALFKGAFDEAKPILEMLKVKVPKSGRGLVDVLDEVPAEKFNKLWSKDNFNQLRKIKETQPEIFEILRKKQIGDILYSATKEGQENINIRTFMSGINKLEPEAQGLIFGGNASNKIKSMNTILNRLPPDVNPSGSGAYLEFKNLIDTVTGAPAQVRDLGLYYAMRAQRAQYQNAVKQVATEEVLKETARATLKGQEKIKSIPKIINETINKKRGPIKSLFIRGINANMTKVERQEEFKKLSDSIADHYVNLEKTTEKLKDDSELMGSEAISAPYTTKVMNGVQYLYNIMPKQTRVQNPFVKLPEYKPSQAEVDSFMTKVELVKNPYLIIDLFKEGLVNSEHIDVVKNVYPSIFGQIQTSFIDSFASGEQKNTSYGDRIRLALLLDVQTDQSMSPEKMMDLQAQFAPQQAAPSNPINLKVSKASPVEQLSNIG